MIVSLSKYFHFSEDIREESGSIRRFKKRIVQ